MPAAPTSAPELQGRRVLVSRAGSGIGLACVSVLLREGASIVAAVRPLPQERHSSHEAGLVLEFVAPEAEIARLAAGVYKQNLLHFGYPGRMSTAGNLAFAFTSSAIDAHEAYRFVLYLVMQDAPLADIFAVRVTEIDGRTVH